ncbi:MAG: hypothetical protein Cons2KO_31500 [Congregibacter sp.]
MKRLSRCLWAAALSLFVGTAAGAETLRLHTPVTQQLNYKALSAILEEETGILLSADPSVAEGDDPLDSLVDGSADLAIVENTRAFQEGVRTVLPLYRGVIHLAVRQDFSSIDWNAGGRVPQVEILSDSHTGKLIADLLFARADAIPREYQLWEEGDPGSPDFIFYVGPIHPEVTDWCRDGYSLLPFSRVDAAGAEFYLEGIRYLVPQLRSTRIPALTYDLPGNQEGIDALEVDMLLVAHKRVDNRIVAVLTRALIEHKARFAAAEPALFRWLSVPNYREGDFAFPLHPGARQYLERDEPGFLERYAESLNFIVYMVVLLSTGGVALGRWRARKRKDRIDTFYMRVLELRRQAGFADPQTVLAQLEDIEGEAFQGLIAERLAADDSFRIFTELAEGLRLELKARLQDSPATGS